MTSVSKGKGYYSPQWLVVLLVSVWLVCFSGIGMAAGNQPPKANGQTVSTNEDTKKIITLKGTDPEKKKLSYAIVSQPAHGTVTLTVTLKGSVATYMPAKDYFSPDGEPDSFTFKVNDGQLDSEPAQVAVTVKGVNDAPVAQAGSATAVKDTALDITLTGTDVEGDALAYTHAKTSKKGGTLKLKSGNVVTYSPKKGFVGADSFTFTVADNKKAKSKAATVTVTVKPVDSTENCPIPHLNDFSGNKINHLSCLDRSRLLYFRKRIAPLLHSNVNSDYEQSKVIVETYSEEKLQEAIDNNPLTSAIESMEGITKAFEVAQGKNGIKRVIGVTANLSKALLKIVQATANKLVLDEKILGDFNNPNSYQDVAYASAKTAEFAQYIIDGLDIYECRDLLLGENAKTSDCVDGLISLVENLDKLGGIEEKKLKLIKAELTLMVDGIKVLDDLSELSFPISADKNEYKRKVFALTGSLHKMVNDGMTVMILGNAQERPTSGWKGLVLGVFDNMSIPLDILGECVGVSKAIDPVDKMKCYAKVAKTVNEQTIRTVFYTMGAVKQYRTLSSINDAVVTQRVLEELLIAGSDNIKSVFDKYGIAYPDGKNAYLDSIRFGLLIKKIGDNNFGYVGIPDYKEWISSLFYSTFKGNPYSVANVRMAVMHYYTRIKNEAFIDESPLIYLHTSTPTENREVTVTAEFDIANTAKFKYGKLVCYTDDSIGSHPFDNPWSADLWNVSPVSFTVKYSSGGRGKIVCKLYNSDGVYTGGRSASIVLSDNDGMPDEWEIRYGLDPTDSADAYADKDGDGLSNSDEFKYKTDPTKQDTDGDGFSDKQEVDGNTDPLDKSKYPVTLSAPTNFKATPADGKVTLSWDAVTNAAGYTVCHATESIANFDNCTSYANGALEDTNGTGLALSGLTNGTAYHFRVIAGDVSGNKSSASVEVTATPKKIGSTGKLNDTGITTCSNDSQNGQGCPLLSHPNQDGDSGRDVTANDDSDGHAGFSFTKISSTGAELPASAIEWSCVKDNVTGLMWEVKTDDNGLHDKDWTYSWYEPDGTKNGGDVGTRSGGSCGGTSQCDTYGYVQAMNAASWCGVRDWRMPTHRELNSIVSNDRYSPAIDTAWFPNTLSTGFWSSLPLAFDGYRARYVEFDSGGDHWGHKSLEGSVRLVRGGQ